MRTDKDEWRHAFACINKRHNAVCNELQQLIYVVYSLRFKWEQYIAVNLFIIVCENKNERLFHLSNYYTGT